MKRSQAVSLVLLAGAGAAAIGIAEHFPPQGDEDVRVYRGPAECIAAHMRTEADCRTEYAAALAAYPNAAPRYPYLIDCQEHHGMGQCVPGETMSEGARGQYVPLMAGFVLGAAVAQALPPQPIFRHANRENDGATGSTSGGGFGGGYCTGSGARIVPPGGSSAARVSSASLRGASTGGFGGTGRGFASAGRGG